MLAPIDKISDAAGRLAGWMFFVIGIFIVYEVVARYVFLSPTVWSEELSRFLQVWATYLAAAHVLRKRQLIAIDIIVRTGGPRLRRWCESLALLVIIIFCLVAVYFGAGIAIDSIRIGRASSSMLAVPSWLTELAIPVGFGLLLLQAMAELIRTLGGSTEIPASHH